MDNGGKIMNNYEGVLFKMKKVQRKNMRGNDTGL